MKITTKSRLFFEAILLTLLISGCSLPLGRNEQLPEFNDVLFGESDWKISYSGLSAGIVDRDPVFAQFPQYGDALVDTHGQVIKLSTQTKPQLLVA